MAHIKLMTRLTVLVLACTVAVVGLARAVEYQAPKPSVDELTRQFEAIVFGSEFKGLKPFNRIKKWVAPLRVAVKSYDETSMMEAEGNAVLSLRQKEVDPVHLSYVQKHLTTLVGLTGLITEDYKAADDVANLTIKIVPRGQLTNPNLIKDISPALIRRLGGQGGCYFLMWHNENTGHIERAEIVVNADRISVRTDHCLLEEMTQSLGLPNDTASNWTTIFSNEGQITSLTRSDQIMIKTLYDPRLNAGMARHSAMEIARKIIGENDRKMP